MPQITVHNDLPSDYPDLSGGLSLHWHGFNMRGREWYAVWVGKVFSTFELALGPRYDGVHARIFILVMTCFMQV